MSTRRLQRDDRGAIMVIALFFAIFGVAMLYTLVGTAQAIFLREKLQDAADSAALSGAVLHARAMNLLVLINIVMSALLAILVTLKLIESIAILGIIVAAALAWITGGSTLGAIPPLKSIQQEVHTVYEDLKDPIHNALKTLHGVADVIGPAVPAIATGAVALDVAEHAAPAHGFAAPPRLTLPVEDGSFEVLCGKAGELPADLGAEVLNAAGVPALPTLMSELSGPMESLASTFSDWFCGDSSGGSGTVPKLTRTVNRSYPRVATADAELCRQVDTGEDDENKPSQDELREACERSEDEEDEGKPDDQTGSCQKGVDCSISGPYEKRIKLAREQCSPTSTPAPYAYWYQQRSGHVAYEWTEAGWKRGEPVMGELTRVGGSPEQGSSQPPCGPKRVSPVGMGYNKVVHPHDDVTETLPVCTTEEPPILPPVGRGRGTIESRDFIEVTQILGCKKSETEDIPITPAEQTENEGNDKSPKVLEKDVVLGDKNFQIRSLMFAPTDSAVGDVVRLALWKNKEADEPLALLRPLTGFAVAQAEYFYDGGEGEGAWMWNMKWRGRLRRFRLVDEEFELIEDACSALPESSDCKYTLTALANTVNLISH